MLSDRVLVHVPDAEGERRSRSGILIPATATVARRLSWAEVAAVGPNVRAIRPGDRNSVQPGGVFRGRGERRGLPHPTGARHPGRRLRTSRGRHGAVLVTAAPAGFTDEEIAGLCFDENGLVAAIVQDATTRDVLMLGWMDAEAVRRTLTSGRTWFWSRSRQEYWCKGETSGDRQHVRAAAYDCDGDALLITVDQEGRGAVSHRGMDLLPPRGSASSPT